MPDPLFESLQFASEESSRKSIPPEPTHSLPDSNWEFPKPPQPGLGLAILIMLAIPVIQVVSTVAYAVLVDRELLAYAAAGELMERLEPGQLARLLAFSQAMFVLMAFLGTWLVFRNRFSRVIPMSLPRARHATIIVLVVLPLAVMDMYLIQQFFSYVESFGITPSEGDLPALMDGLTAGTSTWMLLAILAVAPALGEELVFRGVIGRGLVAQKGILIGILWTSLLFSLVHGNPVQVVGVFFVGVMCHVAYLATRSLAAPVLLHFLNNSLAVMALKSQAALTDAEALAAEQGALSLSPWMALAAAVCVLILGCLLWQSRVEYRDADGEFVPDEYPGVERPETAVRQECRPVPPVWLVLACLSYLLFLASASLTIPA